MSDAQHYRTKAEVMEKQKEDPITYIRDLITKKKYASAKQLDAIDQKVKELVSECEKFADESPYPEKSMMYDAVYDQEDYPFLSHKL